MTLFDYLDAFRGSVGRDAAWWVHPAQVPVAEDPSMMAYDAQLEGWLGAMEAHVAPIDAMEPAEAFDPSWRGEAEIGGMAFTSGTIDVSGQGNDVFMVDGEVLDLPG